MDMKQLVDKLQEACVAYYKYDSPIMSDKEYDALYDELEAMEEETGIVLAGSPTQKVQGYILDGFDEIVHSKPMLSAAKTKNLSDIEKFLSQGYDWYCSGKLDGCFPKDARVKMADGTEKKIVDINIGDYVSSFNETTGLVESKKVINKFYNGRKVNNEWVRIRLYKDDIRHNKYTLKCTKNHMIYTESGWKQASDINIGDKVYRYGYVLSKSQYDFITGMGLGDGWILVRQKDKTHTDSVECHYSKVNKYPHNIMIDKICQLFSFNNPKITARTSGYGSDMYDINLHVINHPLAANDNNRLRIGLTFTDDVLDNLSLLSLAIFYIDDGTRCTCTDDGYEKTKNKQVRCRFALNRHPIDKVYMFSDWMRKHGYYNHIAYEKDIKTDINGSGCYMELTVEGTINFFNDIAPYIPKEYRAIKLGLKPEWQDCDEIKWWEDIGSYGLIPGEVFSISDGYNNHKKGKIRNRKDVGFESYDLEVEDNHTYFVNNYAVHNCTLVTIYENGEFIKGVTRGTGIAGEDVTEACRFIKDLPMKIPYKGRLELRGECVISLDEFNRINENLAVRYKHPRNLASGTIRQLDLNVVKDRKLSYVVFECVTKLMDNKWEELSALGDYGFNTVMRMQPFTATSLKDNIKELSDIMTKMVKEDEYPYDGLIFEINSHSKSEKLGKSNHHENCRMALKWADETYETVLRDVEWNVGKTGVIFPTGIVDEVDLDGALTSKVTLHNITYIKDLELGIGDTVTIYRSNMVIPALDENLTRSNTVEIPEFCPICGAPTRIIKDNKTEVLFCTNDECPGKTLGKWVTFVSKKGMDIDGLSEQTLDKLINFGYLTNMFESVYSLHLYKNELYKIDGFGKKSIDNLLAAIESSKECDLIHFITAFSIPGIGEGQSKLLAKFFKTFDAFSKACDNQYDFSNIPGIGPVLSRNINKWWMLNHMQMLDIANIVSFISDDFMNKPDGNYPLVNKTFVVTGSVHHYKNRAELQKTIEDLGGKVVGSVSKSTSYLINNDATSDSSKNKKAKSLGIPIITEEQFLELIK